MKRVEINFSFQCFGARRRPVVDVGNIYIEIGSVFCCAHVVFSRFSWWKHIFSPGVGRKDAEPPWTMDTTVMVLGYFDETNVSQCTSCRLDSDVWRTSRGLTGSEQCTSGWCLAERFFFIGVVKLNNELVFLIAELFKRGYSWSSTW